MNSTIQYYNNNATNFNNNTLNVEFEDKQNMLLKYLKQGNHILDLGCGSGRDSKSFIDKGYKITAIDGSKELCKLASKYLGQQVICKKFNELEYKNKFDAIWACASILHVPYNELPDIIRKISNALKPEGYFYTSFKNGEFEGIINGRYFTNLTEKKFKVLISPFKELDIVEVTITSDVRPGREDEKWLNIIMKKK